MNKHDNLVVEPRNITRDFKDILKPSQLEYILDIESVLHLEEKGNYFNNDKHEELPNICIIGLIIINNGEHIFKDFTIDNLTIEDETYTDKWRGDIGSDTAQHIGRIEYHVLDHAKSVHLVLELESEKTQADNRYTYSRE